MTFNFQVLIFDRKAQRKANLTTGEHAITREPKVILTWVRDGQHDLSLFIRLPTLWIIIKHAWTAMPQVHSECHSFTVIRNGRDTMPFARIESYESIVIGTESFEFPAHVRLPFLVDAAHHDF